MFAVYEPVMLVHNVRIGTFNCTITFAFIFNSENNRRSRFCRVIVMYMARKFSGAGGGGAEIWRKIDWGCAVETLFETLHSEMEYVFKSKDWGSYKPTPCRAVHTQWKFPFLSMLSICELPREPFSIYEGKEKMYLIMTTYRQDIMTTFSWVHDRSTIFTYFSEHFSKIYTSLHVLVNRSFHAKEQ